MQKKSPSGLLTIILLTLMQLIFEGFLHFNQYKELIPENTVHVETSNNAMSVVYDQLVGFALVHIFLLVLFVAYVFVISYSSRRQLKLPTKNASLWAMFCWLQTSSLLFIANQQYFPNSIYALLPESSSWVNINLLFYLFLTIHMLLLSVTLFYLGQKLLKKPKTLLALLAIPIAILIALYYPSFISIEKNTKPNVILIGFDSLRPDHIKAINPKASTHTPNIDRFINKSVNFNNAYTPLARTFPAWNSILTGNYPINTGARFNLTNLKLINKKPNLATILKQQGYTTVFATDETRFCNIDKHFGFDYVVQPKVGFSDFLLGSVNDNIRSNLLVNSSLGRFLFPFGYLNRAAHVTYYPSAFSRAIDRQLYRIKQRPLFLAVHLELTHWPYTHATYRGAVNTYNLNGTLLYPHYKAMINEIDQQFADIMQTLSDDGLLKNSIVVLLSDHGDGFRLPGDRATDPKNFIATESTPKPELRFTLTRQSQGHGTDILSPAQYNVLYAWKLPNSNAKHAKQPVSLTDTAPTILAALGIKPPTENDGKSLLPIINNEIASFSHPLFLETGLTPQTISLANPDVRNLALENMYLYHIDNYGRMALKAETYPGLVNSKQHAIISDDWMLAHYPNRKKPDSWILINLATRAWTTDLTSQFAINAHAYDLQKQLQDFYNGEI